MGTPDNNYPKTARSEHSNTTEAQEQDLKTNIMRTIEVL